MTKKERYIVGLDIGTTKVTAIVSEVNEDETLDIIGIGSTESKGLRKGTVINLEQTVDSIKRVVDKLVVELEAKLGNNDVTLELDDAAREWIAERGYDPKMGARPMARVIQEQIKRPLAEELLFGSLADGGHVKISVGADDNLLLNAEPALKELEHLPEG